MPQDRERINPRNDARFVRRDEKGRFKQSVDVGRSLAVDRRQSAKSAPSGQGDTGDQKKKSR